MTLKLTRFGIIGRKITLFLFLWQVFYLLFLYKHAFIPILFLIYKFEACKDGVILFEGAEVVKPKLVIRPQSSSFFTPKVSSLDILLTAVSVLLPVIS